MKKAVFLGSLESLRNAYSPETRREIASRVDVLGADISPRQIPARATDLSVAEMVFSTWGMPALDSTLLAAMPTLRAVFYAAGSVKHFATPDAYARGILISSAYAANAIPVAEYTLATIVLGLKRFWSYTALVRHKRCFERSLPVAGAYRSRVGLISLGAIGRLVAERLQGLELDVVAYDPFVSDGDARALRVELASLESVFASCDVVSVHTPWLPETENLISGPLLRSMKAGATLINTSRGAVLDEAALCTVLAERPDLTAILDVTHPEPPVPESPLYTLPNVLLTPHIAGSTGPEVARMGRWMAEELAKYLDGLPLDHAVPQEMLARMA